ncbi:amino acid ABC transporter substrate-binding protein [Endozoicomonas sp. SM1973]|uniref:Amino acid ABC transporter substrate-binding protein n=1 Tax=Spartinivicinus marinus TaxID=2994442 RepID=A0A853IDC0_9GAMM|nr:transporter substrate-binding domain-containing protein [Spartinivicinus marinus]MCX4027744.1 transporter substrate-binding domain-containing protein [Spartinivicinus marinus]NYZ68548.1 amino acid ABC transporter substrate-binding protein [Spartinivicinus marinus]
MIMYSYNQNIAIKNLLLIVISISILISLSLNTLGEPLTVATSVDPPLVIYQEDPNKQHTGSTVELIREVARRLNREIKFEFYPWKRALQVVEAGDVEAICCAGINNERLKFLYFPKLHLTSEENVLFVKKGNRFQIDSSYSNADKINLGVMRGYVYGPMQKVINEQRFMSVTTVDKYEQALHMLLKSRFDIFVGDRLVVAYNAKLIGVRDQVEIIKTNQKVFLVTSWPVHLAFSKKRLKDPSYVNKVTQVITDIKQDGTYDRIIKKYSE